MKIAFIWIQWCWKWTQARILAEKYWFKVLEMWTEFRNVTKSGTEFWNKIKEIIEKWQQVPEDLWKELMKNILLENKDEKIIYDGFIRNEWNLELFEKLVKDYKIVLFELDLVKARDRLYNRVYDPLTWETFSGDLKINPKTWNELVKRQDDKDLEVIKRRFNEFVEKTLPIIEKEQKKWIVIEVNADQSIENVTKELEEKLWLKK